MRPIQIGDSFTYDGGTYTRLPDDPAPVWPCERIRVRFHGNEAMGIPAQLFPAEPEWFRQRGLVVDESQGEP